MFASKILSAAAILALTAGCQTTGSTTPDGGPQWAAHEEISRTYHTRCTARVHDMAVAFDHEGTSRTYEACCPLIPDDPRLSAIGDDTSRTYHTCCAVIPDVHDTQPEGLAAQAAEGTCDGPERESICVHCAR